VLAASLLLAAALADEPRLASLAESLVTAGRPGLAVLVRKDGRNLLQAGYGVRELRTRAPIDARTGFRLASVTKQLTAAAIVLLVRDGRIRYDEPLTEALPGFPDYARAVTIRHLLTHTGGLPDYEELMEQAESAGAARWTPERQIQDDEALSLIEKEAKGRFAPGSRWAYSNSGYVVLGLAAARADGRRFGDVLRARIFEPLGMTRTIAYERGRNEVQDRAFGHSKEASGFRETDQSSTSATLGDGGVYSCLEDLAKWLDALRTHALLTPEETKLVETPVRLADGKAPSWPKEPGGDNLFPGRPVAYGFGWFLDPWRGRPRAWHYGETMGFRSNVQRLTDDGLSVVLLANRDDLDLASMAEKLARAALGR
jgi:CubicO group peptidase (beta-lactamase class C family)